MPTIKQVESAFDEMIKDPGNPKNEVVLKKLGLPNSALGAWQESRTAPDDPKSVKVKNAIFDKIVSTLPVSQEVGATSKLDRFYVKNLIDKDPILQQKYLEKKGYITKHTPQGLEARTKEELQFKPVDPDGFDRFDLMDIIVDAGEAITTGFATGVKAMGALGAPLTGGASIPAAMALGGLATGAFETAKQGAAKALGLRDEFDEGRILQNTLIGSSAGLLGPLVEKGVKASQKAFKAVLPTLRQDVELIKAAAKRLGVKPAIRSLYDNKLIDDITINLEQVSGTVGGFFHRRAAKGRVKSMDDAVEALIGENRGHDLVTIGDKAKEQIKERVGTILEPLENFYNKIEELTKKVTLSDDIKNPLIKKIDDFISDATDKKSRNILNEFKEEILNANNVDRLKKLRTGAGKNIKVYGMQGETILQRNFSELYNNLTVARSDALRKGLNEVPGIGSDQVKTFLKGLNDADKAYAQTAGMIKNALLKRGKDIKGSLRSVVKNFDEVMEEKDVLRKVFNTGDPKKLIKLKKDFPETFELLRSTKISEMVNKVEGAVTDKVSMPKFIQNLKDIPEQTKNIMFGEDALGQINDIKTILKNTADLYSVNASKTSFNGEFLKSLSNQFFALEKSLRLDVMRTSRSINDFIGTVLEQVPQGAFSGATQAAGRQLIPTEKEFNFGIKQKELNFGIPSK